MRAAIYCRVSTAPQLDEGKPSMDDQLERCLKVCSTKSWEVVAVYDEGDASAGTAQRGEFQRMIADAKAGKFDVIVAREVSRLSRVAQARRVIEELMIEWGISVCNGRTGMVYSESDGLGASVIWTIEAKMAEAELAERSFRTTMGMTGKAARGEVPGAKAPYGYRWTGGPKSELVVDERESEIVRRVFDRLAAGATCASVARELTASGIPSPGNSPRGWSASTVHSMAARTAYIGEHKYGLLRWRKLNSERDRRAWAEDYLAKHGHWPSKIPAKVKEPGKQQWDVRTPPIVTGALFERVQARLTRTRKARSAAPRRVRLLAGILRCEECGRPMKSTWAKGRNGVEHFFYRCARHIEEPSYSPCRVSDRKRNLTVYVGCDEIDGLVWGLVDEMLSDPATLAAAIDSQSAAEEQFAPAIQGRIQRHRTRLEKAEQSWDTARRMHYAGEVEDSAYQRDRLFFEREIAMLRDELARMEAALDERHRQAAAAAQLQAVATGWCTLRSLLAESEKRAIVQELIEDVTITQDDRVTVSGMLTALDGSKNERDGGRYWIRTSDLCDVNAAL